MATGYQIWVHETREDPEDWTCSIRYTSDWIYNDKIYTNKEEADKKCAQLKKNHSSHCYGGFDIGYRTYEVVPCTIDSPEDEEDQPEDRVLTFGKYKGTSVSDLISINPSYLIWADDNVSYFQLTEEERNLCEQRMKKRKTYSYRSFGGAMWDEEGNSINSAAEIIDDAVGGAFGDEF